MRIVLFGNDRPLFVAIDHWLVQASKAELLYRVYDKPNKAVLAALEPDLAVSVLYRHRLLPETLALFPRGIVNLHPGYLPWNRGAMPNVWPIIEGTPAGVTLHWMDEGIDTGDIIAQERVEVLPTDTGKTLYDRLMVAAYALFVETWPKVLDGTAPRVRQPTGGSYHRSKDIAKHDELSNLGRGWYSEVGLVNLLRARTFPPYKGCYFEVGGKRVYVRVELEHG